MQLPTFALAVLDKGFVYIGRIQLAGGFLTITQAQNVRRWGTTKGLGQLAAEGPTANSKLDPCPDVFVPVHAVIHLMTCNPEKWPAYAKA